MYYPYQMYYGTEVHLVHVLFGPSHFLLEEAFVKTCFEVWIFKGSGNSKVFSYQTKRFHGIVPL